MPCHVVHVSCTTHTNNASSTEVARVIHTVLPYLESALDHPPPHQPLSASEGEQPRHSPPDVGRDTPTEAKVQQGNPVDHAQRAPQHAVGVLLPATVRGRRAVH